MRFKDPFSSFFVFATDIGINTAFLVCMFYANTGGAFECESRPYIEPFILFFLANLQCALYPLFVFFEMRCCNKGNPARMAQNVRFNQIAQGVLTSMAAINTITMLTFDDVDYVGYPRIVVPSDCETIDGLDMGQTKWFLGMQLYHCIASVLVAMFYMLLSFLCHKKKDCYILLQ